MTLFVFPLALKLICLRPEPDVANPVAFCFDEHGRAYVAETYRIHHGVEDNRWHMEWLDEDLALKPLTTAYPI